MLKKALLVFTVIFASIFLFASCDDGSLIFLNELCIIHHSGGKKSTTITVKADSAAKALNAPDPAFTYKYDPDPLPDGVALTGELTRDPGELAGSYVIRQGTLKLTGANASKYTLKFHINIFYINY